VGHAVTLYRLGIGLGWDLLSHPPFRRLFATFGHCRHILPSAHLAAGTFCRFSGRGWAPEPGSPSWRGGAGGGWCFPQHGAWPVGFATGKFCLTIFGDMISRSKCAESRVKTLQSRSAATIRHIMSNHKTERTGEEAVSELMRELSIRRRCYTRWIADGKLSAVEARDRLERMERALQIVERYVNLVESPVNFPIHESVEVDTQDVKAQP